MKKLYKSALAVLLVMAAIVAVIPVGMISAGADAVVEDCKYKASARTDRARRLDEDAWTEKAKKFATERCSAGEFSAERFTTKKVSKSISITGKTCAQIQSEIQSACDSASSGDIITVTGSKTNGNEVIEIWIPGDVTVVWQAAYKAQNVESAIDLWESEGSFVLLEGGSIETTGGAWALWSDTAYVLIIGGTIKTAGSGAVGILSWWGGMVEIFGGNIQSDGAAIVVWPWATVSIQGGKVKGKDYSIFVSGGIDVPTSAMYYAGTIEGPQYAENGAVFKINSLLIPYAWHGTKKGASVTAGKAKSFSWYTSGMSPVFAFAFDDASDAMLWGFLVTSLPGDANNDWDVTALDATLVLRYVNWAAPRKPTINMANADVNNDTKVTSVDATLILRYVNWTKNRPFLGPVPA